LPLVEVQSDEKRLQIPAHVRELLLDAADKDFEAGGGHGGYLVMSD
jgi:hypothetical protein